MAIVMIMAASGPTIIITKAAIGFRLHHHFPCGRRKIIATGPSVQDS